MIARASPAAKARLLRLVLGAFLVGLILAALTVAGVFDREDDPTIRLAEVGLETPGSATLEVGLREGELAPDFIASDFAGERRRLSDLRGQPVLLNFWATWCIPCKAELPDLQAMNERYAGQGLVVIGLNHGESLSRARSYLSDLEITLTYLLLDPGLDVVGRYDLQGMPTSYFIDADGVIRRVIYGRASAAQLESGIAAAIAGADVRAP
jgi:thiol-disulfide isomerase/thioredoxin